MGVLSLFVCDFEVLENNAIARYVYACVSLLIDMLVYAHFGADNSCS